MDIKSLGTKAKNVCKKTAVNFKNSKAVKLMLAHKIVSASALAVLVMAMLMSVVLIKRNNVKIYIDGVETSAFTTFEDDTERWLEKAGITLYDADVMTREGDTVKIERAFFVTVSADGNMISFKTAKCNVAQAIEKAGLTVGEDDIVSLPLETEMEPFGVITINRVTSDTVTVKKSIDYTTKEVKTDSLYEGETKVVTKGEKGVREFVYKVTYTDGRETDRELVSEKVTKEPVEKVVNVGTKKRPTVTTGTTPTKYKAVYTMKATAYTYGSDGGNWTATGIRPYRGVVAVDRKVIPLGTKLYIETADGKYVYGNAVALDTGMKGNRVDLFMNSERECNAFGRRTVKVYVIE